jgi:hypothetical protein
MSSRPQRKAAVAGEFKRATAGVPDRDSRPTKPRQAQAPADPQPPVEAHAPVEAPKEPAVLQKKRKVAHLTQLAQVAPLDAERVRVKIQPNRERDID